MHIPMCQERVVQGHSVDVRWTDTAMVDSEVEHMAKVVRRFYYATIAC